MPFFFLNVVPLLNLFLAPTYKQSIISIKSTGWFNLELRKRNVNSGKWEDTIFQSHKTRKRKVALEKFKLRYDAALLSSILQYLLALINTTVR